MWRIRNLFQASVLAMLALSIAIIACSPARAFTFNSPIAAFTYNPCVACAVPGDAIFFNASYSLSLSGYIVSYTWDFGDGTPLQKTNIPTTNHIYGGIPGKWTVTLTVQDSKGMIDTISQPIVFYVAPGFYYRPIHPFVGEPITFNGTANVYGTTSTTPTGFQWSFGDGSNATGEIVKHAYQQPGPYRIIMTVISSQGNPSISKTILVRPGILVASTIFNNLNITVMASFTVNSTSRTVTGTLSVSAVNETSGMEIFQKTFNITLSLPSNGPAKFVVGLPRSVSNIGVSMTVDSTGTAFGVVTKNPDLDGQGTVNIADLATAALSFGSTQSSLNWNPDADLNGDGTVNIMDMAAIAFDFGAPVLY